MPRKPAQNRGLLGVTIRDRSGPAVEQAGSASVDAVYYRDGGGLPMARAISARARAAMYELFVRELRPTPATTVLDVGASDEEGPETNMLLKRYPWRHMITCVGLGDGRRLLKSYPGVSYARVAPNARLPFSDETFDIACSNAVLEHVGPRENRIGFIRELLRVSRSIFLTVPNRWFPLEHHTGIPFLHWNPSVFRALLRGSRLAHWSNPANLEFLGERLLTDEWPGEARPTLHYTGLYLGPWSSNLALIGRQSIIDHQVR